jgi:hypothetical protein
MHMIHMICLAALALGLVGPGLGLLTYIVTYMGMGRTIVKRAKKDYLSIITT